MHFRNIIFYKEKHVGTITMNRPKARNALNVEHITELVRAIDEMEKDDEIRAIIITGGDICFCAGFDLKQAKRSNKSVDSLIDQIRTFEKKLENSSRPVIAVISGPCLAGGFEIAISCDLRIASETAIFGLPEIRFGALAIAGATQRLPRIIPVSLAKELHFIGEPIKAREAYRIGLVNRVFPNDAVMEESKKLAVKIAERSPAAMKLCKFLINTGLRVDLNTAMEYETALSRNISGTEDFEKAKRQAAEKEETYRHIFGACD